MKIGRYMYGERFGVSCCLHLLGTNTLEGRSSPLTIWSVKQWFSPKYWKVSIKVLSVIFQKMAISVGTAIRISNLTAVMDFTVTKVYTAWRVCFFWEREREREIQTLCFSCRRLLHLFQGVFSYKLSDTVWWPGHCDVISVRLGRRICVPYILRLIRFFHFRASRRDHVTLTASRIALWWMRPAMPGLRLSFLIHVTQFLSAYLFYTRSTQMCL